MIAYLNGKIFYVDTLALTMVCLISFIGLIVKSYSKRYMQADPKLKQFQSMLALLLATVIVLVTANQLLVFLLAFGSANLILIKLIGHEQRWQAARNSAKLAMKTLGLGYISLGCAFYLLYYHTGLTSIQSILQALRLENKSEVLVLLLLLVTAMTQCALWPFHKWLLSSLNSPTPVSAIMHAGLVNGGGFLLARFAPIYIIKPKMLVMIFIIGLISAILGSAWKLIQNDIKRMLACSTLSQMGFMFVQYGLGLFPFAIAHLCGHGLFKSFLFLNSNSAAQKKRSLINKPKFITFILAILCGIISCYCYLYASQQRFYYHDSLFIMIVIVFITACQFALTALSQLAKKLWFFVACASCFVGYYYGVSARLYEAWFKQLQIINRPINAIHLLGLLILAIAWLLMVFREKLIGKEPRRFLLWLYVKLLNASQSHSTTVTTHRNQYLSN